MSSWAKAKSRRLLGSCLGCRSPDIRESIRTILFTRKGERVMRPDFGCGIHDLIFEPLSATTLRLIEDNVREALTEFELRIELLTVKASDAKIEGGRLEVRIDYLIHDTQGREHLVIPFFMTET